MERQDDDKRRTVVPRWRSLGETPQHELEVVARVPRAKPAPLHILDTVVERWEQDPTVINAAEVADAISLLGPHPKAEPAIAYLRSQQQRLQPLVTSRFSQLPPNSRPPMSMQGVHKAISNKKRQLRDQPRNAIGHVEIARLYAVAAQSNHAAYHMDLAVKVAPNNRYVLRSAARLFVHEDAPLQALHYLQKSEAINVDPWLMAAEVAISDTAGETPTFGIKHLKWLSSVEKASIHYSELASALGALEDGAGSHKIARKLIKRSLDQPTENSLAQALWMSTKAKHQFVDLTKNYNENAYEAGVIQAIHTKKYDVADRFAWSWLNDEPFSSEPACHGSFVNCIFTRAYERAIAFAERGLLSNPDDDVLKNNRAFAMIMAGRLDEGKKLLPVVSRNDPDKRRVIFDLALHGLFNFKSGNFDEGRRFYSEAVKLSRPHHPSLFASAIAHWLENEVLAGQATREQFEKVSMEIDGLLAKYRADKTVWSATKEFLTRHLEAPVDVRSIRNSKTGEMIQFVIR